MTARNLPSAGQQAGESLPPALAEVLEDLRDAAESHDGELPAGLPPAGGLPGGAAVDPRAAGSLAS